MEYQYKFRSEVYLLTLMFIIILVFLFTASYKKKETVVGYTWPSSGIIKLYSPGDGYVSKLLVKEGDTVEVEDKVLELRYKKENEKGYEIKSILADELEKQINHIDEIKISSDYFNKSEIEELKDRKKSFEIRSGFIYRQIETVKKRREILENRINSYEYAVKKNYLSHLDRENLVVSFLKVEQELILLEKQREEVLSEIKKINHEIETLPIKKEKEKINLNLERSKKYYQLVELSGRTREIISATRSGFISSLSIKEGQIINKKQYIASIIPKGSVLNVELLIPTRSYGFIKIGDKVNLKLDAFPYQKFGVVKGKVISLSESPSIPSEVKTLLSTNEPVYKVKVELEKQRIIAYGEDVPIKAGMLLNADIILERRTLIEWIFSPFISIKHNF